MIKNVVIITIDSLRADGTEETYKHFHGKTSKTLKTPFLDTWSNQGRLHYSSYTTNPYTTSAHASLFTGRYPFDHKIRPFFDFEQELNPEIKTLAETLKEQSFQTFFYSDVPELFSVMDIWRGFTVKTYERTDWLFNMLADMKKERNLLFLHLFDVHEPYLLLEDKSAPAVLNEVYCDAITDLQKHLKIHKPLNPHKNPHNAWQQLKKHAAKHSIDEYELFRPMYDKGVNMFDTKRLPQLLEKLDAAGFSTDNTVFVMLSDHGEGYTEFDERNTFAHGGVLGEPTMRNYCSIRSPHIKNEEDHDIFSIAQVKDIILEELDIPYEPLEKISVDSVEYVYGESYENVLHLDIPGTTSKGTFIQELIDTDQTHEYESVLKNRGLFATDHKLIVANRPEFLFEQNPRDPEKFIKDAFKSLFSRLPEQAILDDLIPQLRDNTLSDNQVIDTLMSSDEKITKPFFRYFKTSALQDFEDEFEREEHIKTYLHILKLSMNSSLNAKDIERIIVS